MTINELRVGNYVFDDYSGICVISEIHEKTVLMHHTAFSINGKFDIDKINPIQLTEEWLVKFDAIDHPNYAGWKLLGDFEVRVLESNDKIIFSIGDEFDVIVKHVHQLQNLYFALTGEELTIKQQ